jgi:hypothetical protein
VYDRYVFVPPFTSGWQDDVTSVTLANIAQEPMLSDTAASRA